MSPPNNELRLRDAERLFAEMPIAELIAEWEERLFESERVLLTEELQARGYRMRSLAVPPDDAPDPDEPPAGSGARTGGSHDQYSVYARECQMNGVSRIWAVIGISVKCGRGSRC